MTLRFSIITPTFNRRDMLVEALDSVRRQNWPDVEHIIVDGGSTDGSLQLVACRPELLLIGGPDSGVYDALNKGIAAASGDIVGFLNSDDAYEPEAFVAVAAAFEKDPECASVCGSARLIAGSDIIEMYDREEDKRLTSARTALLGASVINARFFRKAALDKIGLFSTAYRIISDRDFLMRAVTLGVKTRPIEALIYTYRRHQTSLSFSGEAAKRPAIWLELLALARYWAEADAATPADRQIARTLEGRCLGRLVQKEVSEGRVRGAWRLLTKDGRGFSRNFAALVSGLIDAKVARDTHRKVKAPPRVA